MTRCLLAEKNGIEDTKDDFTGRGAARPDSGFPIRDPMRVREGACDGNEGYGSWARRCRSARGVEDGGREGRRQGLVVEGDPAEGRNVAVIARGGLVAPLLG